LKRFEVLLTEEAARDLEEIYDYIAEYDDPSKAGHVLDRIEQVVERLAEFSERGSHPKELLSLGIRDYRQTFFKPYRMIYRVVGQRVCVYLIVDGRRDVQTLLARRLLEK
jgi:toxin ParE1/3/4